MSDIAKALKNKIQGEVRFDALTRHLYSTDASMFQIEPIGVVVPKNRDDLEMAVELALHNRVPVLARGAGTSLAGQSVGEALVIDTSTHLTGVIELNIEERWVKVEPGIVQEQLNRSLAPHGFLFGPDTSTSNRATIGGMAGSNSAGARSILYGKTVDHVMEVDAILADGSHVLFGPMNETELNNRAREQTLEGHIYRETLRIARENKNEVKARFPNIMRRVSGYNLDELTKGPGMNLASLLVGSEGSLGVISALKLSIVPAPKIKGLLVILFHDMISAVESNQVVLEHKPSATELVDSSIISQALTSPALKGKTGFLEGNPDALLIVEFYADNAKELTDKLTRLEQHLRRNKMGFAWVRAVDAAQQAQVWNFRKLGLGLMMGTRGEAKPVAFVEDTAVDPLKLPAYLKDFQAIMEKHGTKAGFYGHSSVGCIHIRPFLNLKKPADQKKMMVLFDEVSSLVQSYGGAMSGEHGDGLARSWLNEKMFGAKLYQAFREIKAAFDPENLMNPGKVVNAPAPTQNLRYHQTRVEIPTFLDFSRNGGLGAELEMCNGNGQCRKMEGIMCPSFQATGEDRHSTRGRANALMAVISGKADKKTLTSRQMYGVMDLCLQCKGCKTECPSQVDMAKLKQEFLFQYQLVHGTPLRSRIFGHVGFLSRMGSAFAPFSNLMAGNILSRLALSAIGITIHRKLPPFVRRRFSKWFRQRRTPAQYAERPTVVLFHDTFVEHNYPYLGRSAVEILEHAGYRVVLPDKKCCGRPFISKGMLKQAKHNAAHNIKVLAEFARQGIPIVGVEPSCILTLKDDYRDLLPGADTNLVADHTFTMDEFIQKLIGEGKLRFKPSTLEREALLHGHCMQKSLVGSQPSLAVLKAVPGLAPKEIESGCCGVAGAFGYEKEHYALSVKIGELRLLPAVRRAKPDALIVANGISCRQQIAHRTERGAKHIVEVVAEALAE